METIKTKAFIINSIRWKESSKIITLYTEKCGKVKVIARGAFKPKSPFAGMLESHQLIEVIFQFKESRALHILKEASLIEGYTKQKLNFAIYPYSLAILETINLIIEESEPDPLFFSFIETLFPAFLEAQEPAYVFIYFLLKIASYLGFKPNLQYCNSGNTQLCNHTVFLSADSGTVYCKNCPASYQSPIRLTKEEFFFLKNLQKVHYRRIGNWEQSVGKPAKMINVLITYIQFHNQSLIQLKSLQLLLP